MKFLVLLGILLSVQVITSYADTCYDGNCSTDKKAEPPNFCGIQDAKSGFKIFVERLNTTATKRIPCSTTVVGAHPKSSFPGIHSFAWGSSGKYTLIVGGRCQGAHNAVDGCKDKDHGFTETTQSHTLWAIDLDQQITYSLPIPANEVYYSTLALINTQSIQVGDFLYIFGGYGWDEQLQLDVTWPVITIINVTSAVNAIKAGSWAQFNSNYTISQAATGFAQVTGGELMYDEANDIFYLVVGQSFYGNYHGDKDAAQYTSQYRGFKLNIERKGQTFSLNRNQVFFNSSYPFGIPADPTLPDSISSDTFGWQYELHRRDLNVAPIISSVGYDGTTLTPGFGIFGGVFDPITNSNFYTVPIFWNYNQIDPLQYTGFHQIFNSYDSATLSLFNPATQTSSVVFFGGLSAFTLDTTSYEVLQTYNLFQLPWTKNISVLSYSLPNYANANANAIRQYEICNNSPESFKDIYTWGTESRFIPFESLKKQEFVIKGKPVSDVYDLSQFPKGKRVPIGYIFGGIESSNSTTKCTRPNHIPYVVSIQAL